MKKKTKKTMITSTQKILKRKERREPRKTLRRKLSAWVICMVFLAWLIRPMRLAKEISRKHTKS